MKIITFYLPQFHSIPENDKWWGEGFTEWVNVKKAEPLFEGHIQPRIPLDNNYYDLSDTDVMRWQTATAKENGIYGFCFYHYWFGGKLLLQKPVENYLREKDIDFPFCICWANEHWTNQWVSDNNDVLMEQKYGDEDEWKAHFDYLLPFLLDPRYIKKDNKPVLVIYRPDLIEKRGDMISCWNSLAVKAGLEGICFMFQRPDAVLSGTAGDMSMFDYCIEYQPLLEFSLMSDEKRRFMKLRKLKRKLMHYIEKHWGVSTEGMKLSRLKTSQLSVYDYDRVWSDIISKKPLFQNSIPGAFVNWDNTPRKGNRGFAVKGADPEKFRDYLKKQIKHAVEDYHQDMIFMFAWNEWSEGGFLEPDEKYGYGFLNAVRDALIETDSFP